MKIIQEASSHRQGGWQGQFHRMVRWVEKFKQLTIREELFDDKTHDYFDTMYACFQNIFILKDWLINDPSLTQSEKEKRRNELNSFIKSNKEMGICRDICNGTKHFDISDSSVDKDFGIIKQTVHFHKARKTAKNEFIICAGGNTYKPLALIVKCISLWDNFISEKLNLEKIHNQTTNDKADG